MPLLSFDINIEGYITPTFLELDLEMGFHTATHLLYCRIKIGARVLTHYDFHSIHSLFTLCNVMRVGTYSTSK